MSADELVTIATNVSCIRYVVFQLEVSASGTPHYQGYIELTRPQRLNWIRNNFAAAHYEVRRGTREEAQSYARKDDTRLAGPWEYGDFNSGGTGTRNDLSGVIEACKTGSLKRVADEHPEAMIRYPRLVRPPYRFSSDSYRGVTLLTRFYWPRRSAAPIVYLLYGTTGCGKTRFVNDVFPIGDTSYRKPPDTKWFDDYDQHQVLLLDDFSGAASKMSLCYVLQLLDRYEFTVEVKGASLPMLATKIFITTNNHPSTWYTWFKREEQYKALCRRFHYVFGFKHGRPLTLNRKLFFGTLIPSTLEGGYQQQDCEWEERPGMDPMPPMEQHA